MPETGMVHIDADSQRDASLRRVRLANSHDRVRGECVLVDDSRLAGSALGRGFSRRRGVSV